MQINPSASHSSAQLPLHQAGGGAASDFSSRIRAQLAREMQGGAAPAQPAARVSDLKRYATTQQALLSFGAGGDSSYYAGLTRSIGSQYLPSQLIDIFTRQIALESGNFSPDVISGRRVSSAGAEGIAQLMPASYPNVNRLDPVQSLNAAGATMQSNLQRYSGDVRKALAAYNAGAGRVDEAVSRHGAAWEQDLPAETQQYLQLLVGRPPG
jgi:soluble lytic murein transglycosylase-like protein